MSEHTNRPGLIIVNQLGDRALPVLSLLISADALGFISTDIDELFRLTGKGACLAADSTIACDAILKRLSTLPACSRPRVLVLGPCDNAADESGVYILPEAASEGRILGIANVLRGNPPTA